MNTQPYREPAVQPEEPKKEWWEEEEPTEKERELWVRFHEAFVASPRAWKMADGRVDSAGGADELMRQYRKRFGRI